MPMMQSERVLEPEDLDQLDPADCEAIRSRADLRRLHWFMGTQGILLKALQRLPHPPRRILELGAGDGTLMLRVARTLAARSAADRPNSWRDVRITLLDQHRVVTDATLAAYATAGWHAAPLQSSVERFFCKTVGSADVSPTDTDRFDMVVANLFLHHFSAEALRAMLASAAQRCDAFIACEPRRSARSLVASHLVGLAGANAITRKDAVLSVRAGFRNTELSALWPPSAGWRLWEDSAGLFSHCFVACRDLVGEAP
jgi:hypothetical protein